MTTKPEELDGAPPSKKICTISQSHDEDGSYFHSPDVKITLGGLFPAFEKAKTFFYNKRILIENSDYFAAVLRNNKHQQVELTFDDPDIFNIFLCFLHFHDIRSATPCTPPATDVLEFSRLQHCWELGEKLGCIRFQDAVMDTLIAKLAASGKPPSSWHEFPYSISQRPNSLKRLVVDVAASQWTRERLKEEIDDHKEQSAFLFDLTARLLESPPKGDLASLAESPCAYHEHVEKGLSCYKNQWPWSQWCTE